MSSSPSKADVEARLQDTADSITGRLDALQEEAASTGLSIRDWIAENPLKSVGAMLAAGLVVGGLFGGGRSKPASRTGDGAKGRSALEDLEEEGRRPLVVYADENRSASSSSLVRDILGSSAQIFFRTGLTLVARDLIESVLSNTDIEDALHDELFE